MTACFDGFGDGDAQAAGRIGIFGQNVAAGLGFGARAGDTIAAPDLHHQLAEGLLVKADAHHKDLAFQPDQLAGKRQGRTPLAGAGFGGQPFDAELLIVPRLRHGGIGLVAAGGAECFHLCNRSWPASPGTAPDTPHGASGAGRQRYRISRISSGISIHRWVLTSCSMIFIGKTGASISGVIGLAIRAQRRQQRRRQIGGDVVPLTRDVFFIQQIFRFIISSPDYK